jgi:hypothetical protein
MFAKIDLLKDMEYLTDIEMLSTLILDQCKKKETPTLKEMSKAIARIFFYVNSLQVDRKMYDKAMSQYRSEKNNAIMRARKSDVRIKELEEELKKWKKI